VVLFSALREALRGRPVGWRGVEPQAPPASRPPATVAQT
jgi:hypothetical protein